jgi:DNA-binding beta-propeller fold protein YncE
VHKTVDGKPAPERFCNVQPPDDGRALHRCGKRKDDKSADVNNNKGFSILLLACFFFLLQPGLSDAVECTTSRFLFDIKPETDQPSDIAIAPTGDLYLVDGVNNRIVVIGRNRSPKFRGGRGAGEFTRPLGIDISSDGEVFIADTGNHRIQVFDPAGKYVYQFPVKTRPGEKPADPVDVLASNFKGYLYVSDNDNHKIRVFSRNGRFLFEWGRFGELPGEFKYPAMLAVNQFNQVFVVDVLNTRVQVFDPSGNFISAIGSWGVLPGSLYRPKGVAVDQNDRVFVSDSYMGLVQVFTSLGRFLGVVCENGKKKKFTTPVGMAFDSRNRRLHVVEMRANAIQVLSITD